MTKKKLLEKIAELEKRIKALEETPRVVINNHPGFVPQPVMPMPQPLLPWQPNPWGDTIITCSA